MSEHTKGPWELLHITGNGMGGGYDHYEIRHNGVLIIINYDRANKNRLADMTLATAAPDLLEALEGMIFGAGAVAVPHEGERKALQMAVDHALAAIAKAKGEA